MRLFLLTTLTMLAFAANSVLNRMAIRVEGADALAFAALRLVAGAGVLLILRRGRLTEAGALLSRRRLSGAACLLLYMLGFSLAYRALDAGAGALILFGGVQLTMFAGAALAGEAVTARRILGAAIAFAGLVWLVAPGHGAQIDPLAAGLMALAALGWGGYSLIGRGETAPLAATAASFVLACVPAVALALAQAQAMLSGRAAVLALASGAVTSGLGYALWYRILPALGASRAAVAQLTVPVIALALGVALLGERPDLTALLATLLVLGGVALSLVRGRQT